MLILNIKNNELTAKEVSNDTLNIKDSNLFARGVNTILASGEKAGLERWFWSRYKLTAAAIKKMGYVLTPDESHEYESADFEKAALLNQLDDFMSNQTITLPCVNVVNEAGNNEKVELECASSLDEIRAIEPQCAYYCISMGKNTREAVYDGDKCKLRTYSIGGHEDVFKIAREYAISHDENLISECKRKLTEIGQKFNTQKETEVLRRYKFDIKKKVAVAVMNSVADKITRDNMGVVKITHAGKKSINKSIACALFHIPLDAPAKSVMTELTI